jgi:cytochrome o ubiquinol oxidase operon protein cyoD
MSTDSYFEKIGVVPEQKGSREILSYVIGFVSSLILTLTAYFLVTHHVLMREPLMVFILALALIQFILQLVFFLHLRNDDASRARLIILIWASVVVLILVSGSIGIIVSLNARTGMTQTQMTTYMNNEQGI